MRTLFLTLRPPPPSPPCFSPFSSSSHPSFLLKPNHHRFHFHSPCSSLRQTKNKTSRLQKTTTAPPQSLKWLFNNPKSDDGGEIEKIGGGGGGGGGDDEGEGGLALKGTILAGLFLVGLVGGLGAAGYVYKDQVNAFLNQFTTLIEGYGPAGYALFVAVYAGLEILAIPAVPLTMSAGLLFGTVTGSILVSLSGTVAASVAFLIARYFARERILKMVEGNKKFLAIDKAIGENGFRVVTLLRLSPLLPFSLGNYLYGLTSVKFVPYVLGRFVLPYFLFT
ncbi:hypothetical protein ABKV19_001177 [Rosa sericea]